MSSYIYLASPYSHPNAEVRARRYRMALRISARLIQQGTPIFSPIVHSHEIAQLLNMDDVFGIRFWKRWDQALLRHAEQLWYVTAPGWEESAGLETELKIAESIGLPSYAIVPLANEWEGFPDETEAAE